MTVRPPWQNPIYPPAMPIADMEVLARQASMERAQSPGQRVCLIDETTALEYPTHAHSYEECMNYRHDHVVADSDPWTYWQLLDQVVAKFMQPPPKPIPPPVGWNSRARVNPSGISHMDGMTQGWQGFSFATLVGASKIMLGPGTNTRVTISGMGLFTRVYIGPASATPFIATYLYPLTWGGGGATFSPQPPDWVATSDPLPHGIDFPNGAIVMAYCNDVDPGQPTALLGHRVDEPDWYARWAYGDWNGHVNFTTKEWERSPFSSLGLLSIEAFY